MELIKNPTIILDGNYSREGLTSSIGAEKTALLEEIGKIDLELALLLLDSNYQKDFANTMLDAWEEHWSHVESEQLRQSLENVYDASLEAHYEGDWEEAKRLDALLKQEAIESANEFTDTQYLLNKLNK